MLKKILRTLDRFFTWTYSSKYNPLHRSGTLVVGLLTAILISGFYLIFFYRVGSPYESMVDIQNQWYLGKWIRSFHRYATDVAAIAIFYHLLLMFSQGKSWGPRTLAWVSGILLLGAFFISGWTGYVMVWDQHGQKLAQEGARLFQIAPFLHDDLISSFSGQIKLGGSFFFMNLFMHVAIPLGMVFGLWLHTSKMAKIQVFPDKKIFYSLIAVILFFSVFFSAPLLEKGNVLKIVGKIPVDLWLNFLIPLNALASPNITLLLFASGFLFLISVVFWSKPKTQKISPAVNDMHKCTGCQQCFTDCPYEAITMIPSDLNRAKKVASPDPEICAMCGICAGSCSELNIAPPEINGTIQLEKAKVFAEAHVNPEAYVIIGCSANFVDDPGFKSAINKLFPSNPNVIAYPTGCSGQLHTYVVRYFLEKYKGVYIWTCPTRACENREGPHILHERLLGRNLPAFNVRSKNRERVCIVNYSSFEGSKAVNDFNSFVKGEIVEEKSNFNFLQLSKIALVSMLLVGIVVAANQFPFGKFPADAVIRFNLLLPNLKRENCHTSTSDELKSQLKHMQMLKTCDEAYLTHKIQVTVNGNTIYDSIAEKKHHELKLMRTYFEHPVNPGQNTVSVNIQTSDSNGKLLDQQTLNETYDIQDKEIKLIFYRDGFAK